jgi:TonB family protein
VDEARHALTESIANADGKSAEEIGALRDIVRALDEARTLAARVEAARGGGGDWVRGFGSTRVGVARANDAFKAGGGSRYAAGMITAVTLHVSALVLMPVFRAPGFGPGDEPLEAVDLPPELSIPPPPDEIIRPATPQVAAFEVDETITIAATTFEANPVRLPPPLLRESHRVLSDRPTFIPYTEAPELVNREEILVYLAELYPKWARLAKLEASVLLYLFIDEEGLVQQSVVVEPSVYDGFDNAAVEVAKQMVWSPALNRDRAIAVWLMQLITFTPGGSVVGGGIRLP